MLLKPTLLTLTLTLAIGLVLSPMAAWAQLPPVHPVPPQPAAKQRVASALTQQVVQWLEAHPVGNELGQVAIITRLGGLGVKRVDPSGMVHAAFVFKPTAKALAALGLSHQHYPNSKGWYVQQLLITQRGPNPQAGVFTNALEEFYLEQDNQQVKTWLISLPPKSQPALQEDLDAGVMAQRFFTPQYSVLSHYTYPYSTNCNKWLISNLLLSTGVGHSEEQVRHLLQATFKATPVTMDPLLWLVLRLQGKNNTMAWAELHYPQNRPLKVVTVHSLGHNPYVQAVHQLP